MKNTIRRLLAMALALIMVFGTVPAFAAEIGDITLWDDDYTEEEYYTEHRYGGKVTEGENTVSLNTEEHGYFAYYEFDATETGYYLISDFAYFGEYDNEGIIQYSELPIEWIETDGEYYGLVYLEEGTVVLGVCFFDFDYATLRIEYVGEEITDIVYDETVIKDMIINSDVFPYGNYFDLYCDTYTVEFSNGKKIEVVDDYLEFELENEPVNGENAAVLTFADYEEDATATMYYITYFVESIELSNVDEYTTAYEYYNGRYGFFEYHDEEITVNYTDGTSETFIYGWDEEMNQKAYITLLGKEHYIAIYNSEIDLTLTANIAEHTFVSYDCKTEKVNIRSNTDYLKENLAWEVEIFLENMKFYFTSMLTPDNFESFFVYAKYFFENFERLSSIAEEITTYLRFTFS